MVLTGPDAPRAMARVVSYRPRREALSARQQRAWDTWWPVWGARVPYFDHGPGGIGSGVPPAGQSVPARLDTAAWFGRDAPLVLEIGFGTGTATARMAAAEPDVDVLGVEVYTPGIAQLFGHCAAAQVSWVRALHGDAVTVLRHLLAPGSLAGVRVFFPDPWPKRRHVGRRLLQPAVVALIASRLAPGATLHVATDIDDYAEQIRAAGDGEALLGPPPRDAPVSLRRPITKFERRANAAGSTVTDLVWGRLG